MIEIKKGIVFSNDIKRILKGINAKVTHVRMMI